MLASLFLISCQSTPDGLSDPTPTPPTLPTPPTTSPPPPAPTSPDAPPGTPLRSDLPRDFDPQIDDEAYVAQMAAQRRFGSALHAHLAGPDENLVFSPWALSWILGMVYAGAEGATEAEMARVCGFDLPEPDLHAAFNRTDLALAERDVVYGKRRLSMKVVGAGWVNPGVAIEPAFLDVLAVHYGTGLSSLPLSSDPAGSAEVINDWVAEQTGGLIEELFGSDSLQNAVLALADAVAFSGDWEQPFDIQLTVDADFSLLDGGTVQVPTMYSETSGGVRARGGVGGGVAPLCSRRVVDGRGRAR